MRKFIDLILEAESNLKQQVVSLVQQTDDTEILKKVLLALKSTDLDGKLKSVLKQDVDANKMIDKLANLIVQVDGTVEEKEQFANDYSKGFIDVSALLSGSQHSFNDIVSNPFANRVFRVLATELSAHGVGPGELALAILSPKIKHSGRASGGGDLNINGKAVEVKTTVSKGGRWSDARKANLDMNSIKNELAKILEPAGLQVPARLGISYWVNTVRPLLTDNEQLNRMAEIMAKGLFSHVDNNKYKEALKTGDAADIADAVLSVGYDNYKKYAGFDGMLLVDVRGAGLVQYFESYDDMRGSIKASTIYLMAPESEAMPQVVLTASPTIAQDAAPTGAKVAAKVANIDQQIADIDKPSQGIRPPGAEELRAKRAAPSEPRARR
jgi:hypothetical protein